MTTIVITKDGEGKLVGLGKKDRQAYTRFRKRLEALEPGEIMTLDHWFPRHKKFHRLHFVMINAIYDQQEQFTDVDRLRDWLTIGAGHAIFVPHPNGRTMAMADSIAYKRMDDVQFKEHHEKVKDFLRSPRAVQFLWPHLSDQEAGEMVESILVQFERDE